MGNKRELMREMRRNGATYQKIGDAFGVDRKVAWYYVNSDPGKKGKPRLPDDVYNTMRKLRAEGLTYAEIAKAVGKDPGTVWRCINGRREPEYRETPMAKWARMAI